MNMASAIAIYASVCKELGEPLHFTGNLPGYTTFDTHSSAKLVAGMYIYSIHCTASPVLVGERTDTDM